MLFNVIRVCDPQTTIALLLQFKKCIQGSISSSTATQCAWVRLPPTQTLQTISAQGCSGCSSAAPTAQAQTWWQMNGSHLIQQLTGFSFHSVILHFRIKLFVCFMSAILLQQWSQWSLYCKKKTHNIRKRLKQSPCEQALCEGGDKECNFNRK